MGILNKMCCLSFVAFSYDLAMARSAFDAYLLSDYHFDESKKSTEFISEPSNRVPEMWVFGA